jgi:hypothetical protein
MSRLTMVAGLLACLGLTAGCSSSDPGEAVTAPVTTEVAGSATAEPSEPASALAGMSAAQVWAKTKADVADVKSVHIAAKMVDGKDRISLNLKLSDKGKALGVMTINGDELTIRRLGDVLYFKAQRGFWVKNAGADATSAKEMAARWFRSTKGASKDTADFFQFTDMKVLLKETMKMTAAERKSLKRVKGITIAGQKTVGLSIKSQELDRLYVTDADPALPMNMMMVKDKQQYMKFRGWNEDFQVKAPTGSVNMDPRS